MKDIEELRDVKTIFEIFNCKLIGLFHHVQSLKHCISCQTIPFPKGQHLENDFMRKPN